MKLLIVICDRNLTDKVMKSLAEIGVNYHISCYAKGTANSEILSYFGLAETDKELILSFVDKEKLESVMKKLEGLEFIRKHGAVAFAIPLDGAAKKSLDFIQNVEG